MRNVMTRVKFHSLGKCDNPIEPCRIPDNCHDHFSRLNGDSLLLRGFDSLGKPDPLMIYRNIESGFISCYNVIPRPVFLMLGHLEEFK
jgi:hypothetical protein